MVCEALQAVRVPQPAEGVLLDLPDPFTGEVEGVRDGLERLAGPLSVEAEA